jgi:shikimate dehydrogenase
VLHRAAYQALGLSDWTYDRVSCGAEELPDFVAGLGPEWAGLSVTMPGKYAALRAATEVTALAEVVGAANTLVPVPGGWRADCTDVAGVVGALRAVCPASVLADASGVVLGAGGTAAAAVAGLVSLGVREIRVVARDPGKAAPLVSVADRLGGVAEVVPWASLADVVSERDVLVSTIPAEASAPFADVIAGAAGVLDVIYHPWPTAVASAVTARAGRLATGLDMLLHQAFGQVEQFTGQAAPQAAMRDALRAATGHHVW